MLVLEENNYLQAIDKRSSVVSSKIYNGGAFFSLTPYVLPETHGAINLLTFPCCEQHAAQATQATQAAKLSH